MKVHELVEKLLTLPQDAEVAVHCGEDSSKILELKLIRRPPRVRAFYVIVRSLGSNDPMNCKDKKLLDEADRIHDKELAARKEWLEKNDAFAEPYCRGDDFFEMYGHYKDDKVTEAVCIIGEDF